MSAGATTTDFLYDGDALVAEYDSSGNLLRRYVHGSGVNEPLLWYEGSSLSDRHHLRTDHLGSIVAIADASGNTDTINTFDEYGKRGAENDGRFQYTRQILISELGLYYYKARMYSAELGRFLQTDPIGYEDQMNLYAYVGNDPLNFNDPFGLCQVATGTLTDCATIIQGTLVSQDLASQIMDHDGPLPGDGGDVAPSLMPASGVDLGDSKEFAKSQVNGMLGDIHSVHDPVADIANSVAKESAIALGGGPAIRGAVWGLRGVGRLASRLHQSALASVRSRAITRGAMEIFSQADTAIQFRYAEVLSLPPPAPIVTIEHVVQAPNIGWIRYVE